MNDEQRSLREFWAQPFGAGPFFRQAALRLAHIAVLYRARRALPGEKMAAAALID
jgi:hypothetical protein